MKYLLSRIFYNISHNKVKLFLKKYDKSQVAMLKLLWKAGIIYGFEKIKISNNQDCILIYLKEISIKAPLQLKGTEMCYNLSWYKLKGLSEIENNSIFFVRTIFGPLDIKTAYKMRLGGNLIIKCF